MLYCQIAVRKRDWRGGRRTQVRFCADYFMSLNFHVLWMVGVLAPWWFY